MNLGLEEARLFAKFLPTEELYKACQGALKKHFEAPTEQTKKNVHQTALLIVIKGFDGDKSPEEIIKSSRTVKEMVELHRQVKNL